MSFEPLIAYGLVEAGKLDEAHSPDVCRVIYTSDRKYQQLSKLPASQCSVSDQSSGPAVTIICCRAAV